MSTASGPSPGRRGAAAACARKSPRNASIEPGTRSQPAASGWPPKRTKWRAHAANVAARSSVPAGARADPRHGSTDVEKTTAGRRSDSASLPAMRPISPTGHDPTTTTAGASPGSPTTAFASATAVAVRSRLARFVSSSRSASASASAGSDVSSRADASVTSPTRPAAFRRGASANEIASASRRSAARPAARTREARPGRLPRRIRSSPRRTIARFSPTSGATSAIVPTVARSARSSQASSPPAASASSSWARRNAMPAPVRRGSGYALSARYGFTSASAAGTRSGT